MVKWVFDLQNGLGAMDYRSVVHMLKPGEAPAERINIGRRGYLFKTAGIENGVGKAVYHCIMEAI